MCIFCEENEWKLMVDRLTGKQTAAKQYALLSSKGGGIKRLQETNYIDQILKKNEALTMPTPPSTFNG